MVESYLQHGQIGLSSKGHLLLVAGIGIVTMVVKPLLQGLDGLLGQVSPSLSVQCSP